MGDSDKENVVKVLRKVTTGKLDDVIELLGWMGASTSTAGSPRRGRRRCARAGNVEVATALIEKEASASEECIKSRTCLHVASEVCADDETRAV